MELGEADASGRRRPIAIEGETIWVEVDQVIVSVGVSLIRLFHQHFKD